MIVKRIYLVQDFITKLNVIKKAPFCFRNIEDIKNFETIRKEHVKIMSKEEK